MRRVLLQGRAATAHLMWVALVGLVLSRPASAQDVSVSTQVTSDRVLVGDAFNFVINVENTQSAEPPDVSGIEDFSVEYEGGRNSSQTFISTVNGRMTQTTTQKYSMVFTLTALKPGALTIPALTIRVGGANGKEYQTTPITIFASDPARSGDTMLRIQGPARPVYAGEPVQLTVRWHFTGAARNPNLVLGPAPDGVELLPGPDPRPQGAGGNGGADRQYYELSIPSVGSVVGKLGRTTVDGRDYDTLTFDLVAIARQDGAVALGPWRIAFDAVVGRREATFFDSPFDDRSITERRIAVSDEVKLDVKPLPTAGRPPNFNGLVGAYRISTNLSASEVRVGDPMTLNIRVDGPPPLESVPPLNLRAQPGLADDFRTSSEPLLPQVKNGAAFFSDTIRVAGAGVRELPPIQLPYFDVNAGEYRIAESKAIPLTVTAAGEVVVPDLSNGGNSDAIGGAGRAAAGHDTQVRIGGLPPLERDISAMLTQGFTLAGTIRSPLLLGLVGGPPIVLACAGGALMLHRRRLANPAAIRRRSALRRAQATLKASAKGSGSEAAVAAASAVCSLIADMTNVPAGSLTPAECVEHLRRTGFEQCEEAGRLLDVCDAARYGGRVEAGVESAKIEERAGNLLVLIERHLKRKAA